MVSEAPITDFTTIKEEWTDYDLADGSLVRLKIVLNYIEKDNDHHSMNVRHLIALWTPPERCNPKAAEAALPVDQLSEFIEEEGVMSRPRGYGQSIYKTPLGVITLEIRAHRFHRTSKFDEAGLPQYIVEQEVRISGPERRQIPGQRQPRKRPEKSKK